MLSIRLYLQIYEAQALKYNYILVVGEKEVGTRQVSVRERGSDNYYLKSVDDLLVQFKQDVASYKR